MLFQVGDSVHVVSLGKGIVREVRNGRYLVEIKGHAMLVDATQLTAIQQAQPRRRAVASEQAQDGPPLTRAGVPTSIDLHGMTAAEAIAAVDEFLSDAILAGHAEVQVIHGRSGGRLRDAVHRRLKQLPTVKLFRLDPGNTGVTIVSF